MILSLLTLAGALALGSGATQEQGVPGNAEQRAPSQEDHWSRLGSWSGEGLAPAQIRQELADATVRLQVDTDLAPLRQVMDHLLFQASKREYFEGQAELLVEIARCRSELLQLLGDHEGALAATYEVLIPVELGMGYTGTVKLRSMRSGSTPVALEAAADPRLTSLRENLRAGSPRPSNAQGDNIRRLVTEALAEANFKLIRQLGLPALEPLQDFALSQPSFFPEEGHHDPLFLMIDIDARRSGRFMLDHLGHGELLWRKRILRAMLGQNILRNEVHWTSGDGDAPIQCLSPEWTGILIAFLGDPQTASTSLPLVAQYVRRDAVPPALAKVLVEVMPRYDNSFVNGLIKLFDIEGAAPSWKPVIEAAALHPSPHVQRFAASKLVHYEGTGVIGHLAASPLPELRLAATRLLGEHEGIRATISTNDGPRNRGKQTHRPRLTASDRTLLLELVEDGDPAVRRSAAFRVAALDPPFENGVYLRLAASEDPGIRMALTVARTVPTALAARLLEGLAADPDQGVRQSVDNRLGSEPDLDPFLGALGTRLLAQDSNSNFVHNLTTQVSKSRRGRALLVELELSQEEREFLPFLGGMERLLLGELPAPRLAEFFVYLHRHHPTYFRSFWSRVQPQDVQQAGFSQVGIQRSKVDPLAMQLLLSDPDAPRDLRVLAAPLAKAGTDEERLAALDSLLTDPTWASDPPTAEHASKLQGALGGLSPRARAGYQLKVVQTPAIPDRIAAAVANEYDAQGPLGPATTEAVLARWFVEAPAEYEVVEQALFQHLLAAESLDLDRLEEAARLPFFAETAVQVMGVRKDPACLPLLSSIMSGKLDYYGYASASGEAAEAIASFMTPEAASYLIEGLRSPHNHIQGVCRTGLSRLAEYHEELRRWEGTERPRPTKEGALAALLDMLESETPAIRAEAAKGLATLGAVEVLPQLILLLQDEDASVQKAAREALDRLNRETPEPR